MRYKYTEEDLIFLKNNFKEASWEYLLSYFPNLSKMAIYKKAYKMGLTKDAPKTKRQISSKTQWSEQELSILKELYSCHPIDFILDKLPNRSKQSISLKANSLGLCSYNYYNSRWNEDEILFIISNYQQMSDLAISKKINRTKRAIKAKRLELGLYHRDLDKLSYPNLNKFFRGQLQEWKNKSMAQCDYKCVLTGSKNFQIHHLYSFSEIMNGFISKFGLDINKKIDEYSSEELYILGKNFVEEHNKYPLGVCIRTDLHSMFHSLYGQTKNSPNQWNCFVSNFKKGLYDLNFNQQEL